MHDTDGNPYKKDLKTLIFLSLVSQVVFSFLFLLLSMILSMGCIWPQVGVLHVFSVGFTLALQHRMMDIHEM